MRSGIAHGRPEGFTVWDLLIVVTTLLLFAAWLLVPMSRSQVRTKRINCVSNLKQIGLAFRMWSNDHAEQFPWMVSTNEGGTREFVDQGGVLFHFRAISNEVTTPKVLACVTDRSRTRATSFAPVPNGPSSVYLNNATTQISYFVGLDA